MCYASFPRAETILHSGARKALIFLKSALSSFLILSIGTFGQPADFGDIDCWCDLPHLYTRDGKSSDSLTTSEFTPSN